MAIFQKKKTTVYAKIQSAKGSPATVGDADAIDPTIDSGFVQPKGEQVDRGLIRGGRWPSEQAICGRWGEGSLTLELRGSDTAGTIPEFSPLLETLLGTKYATVADTVEVGSGAVGGFDASEEWAVGTLVRVAIGTGYEVRRIATVTGSGPYTYTVQRNFSEAPADGAAITAGITYLHLGTETEQYLTLDQYLDGLRLLCTDAVCESLSVSASERAIIQGVFGLRSLTCAETDTTDSNSPTYDDSVPLCGTECNLIFDGSILDMKSLEFNLTTRRSRGGINSAGFSELPFAGQFEAAATMTPWVEDKTPITDFFTGGTVNAELTKGDTAGNILHIELVGLQRTGPEIGEDEGDFSWNDPLTITGGVYIGLF
ncbi:MAG: hypothetical protein GQ578_06385 [Desulfuromonadaceae bacterium]|nr:hypothetical protein [Desulfuromonadaceae bacterium]